MHGLGFDDSLRTNSLYGHLSHMNPFFDYSSVFQPAIWHNALRWCHTPETLIEVADCGEKPIANVRVGDWVWTPDGWNRVTNTFFRHVDTELIALKPAGMPELLLTPEHRMYVASHPGGVMDLKPACEIQEGDYFVSPIRRSAPLPEGLNLTADHTVAFVTELLSSDIDSLQAQKALDQILREHFVKRGNRYVVPLSKISLAYLAGRLAERCGLQFRFTWSSLEFLNDDPNIDACDHWVYRRVEYVRPVPYKGHVHSISVENSYNYVANGVLSRNCEYVVSSNGLLRSALRRVISFFITDLVIEGGDREKRAQYYDYLVNDLRLIEMLRVISMDFVTYGNYFISLIEPFDRRLVCSKCNFSFSMLSRPLEERYVYKKGHFHGSCPNCKADTAFKYVDIPKRTNGLIIKRWNIFEINLESDPYSDQVRIIWRIPKSYKDELARGEVFKVANAPIVVLEAVESGADLLLNPDEVFFGRDDALVGLRLRGWGLSRIFMVMRHAWYFQVLHRVNEAIGLDYTTPLRIITPMPRPGAEGSDVLGTINLSSFMRHIMTIVDARRRDPTIWQVSPYPIQYNALGGDGRVFAPRDLFENAMDILLSSSDVPIEFYKGTMTLQAAPLGLRIMEAMWSDMFHLNNRLLRWMSKKFIKLLDWDEDVVVKLAQPRHIDDINRQMAKIQLMMSGAISKTEVLRTLGIDLETDIRQRMEEQVLEIQESEKIKEQLQGAEASKQMSQGQGPGAMGPMGGGPPPGPGGAGTGGGPAPQPGGAPPVGDPVAQILASVPPANQLQQIDPQELNQQAEALAQQLFQLDATTRNSALRRLKQHNETVWMIVKSKLDDIYDAARRQGVVQAQKGGLM